MMDYIDMEQGSEGQRYVLMLADKFSKIVEFVPAPAPTAITACNAVLKWASRYGMPTWIISDGGSHFRNRAMELLCERMGIQHHVTLAYCPWANGSIEIVGRELLWTMRAMISELGFSATDWVLLLYLVQYVVNLRERDVLGGRCPIEVMTGIPPAAALDIVLWDGVLLKDATGHTIHSDRVNQYCTALQAAIDTMHEELKDAAQKRRRQLAARQTNAERALQFEVGDLVMVAAWGNAAHVKRGSKLCPSWQGPYEVVAAVSTTAYSVRLIGRPDKPPKTVHWSRMKRFGSAGFDISERLTRTAVNDCQKFEIDRFMAWRCDSNGEVELMARWHGFEPEDDTWEDLRQLYDDVPVLVRKYLSEHAGEDDQLDEAAASLQ